MHLDLLQKHIAPKAYGHYLPSLAERLILSHACLCIKIIKISKGQLEESFFKMWTIQNARQGQKMNEL